MKACSQLAEAAERPRILLHDTVGGTRDDDENVLFAVFVGRGPEDGARSRGRAERLFHDFVNDREREERQHQNRPLSVAYEIGQRVVMMMFVVAGVAWW